MAPNEGEDEAAIQPRIVRGRVESLSLYEVTDYELELLEQGSPGTTYLNFAIFFLSIAGSFLTALLTGGQVSERPFTVFVIVIAVSLAMGGVLLVLWFRTRARVTTVIHKIKARCLVESGVRTTSPPRTPAAPETESSG